MATKTLKKRARSTLARYYLGLAKAEAADGEFAQAQSDWSDAIKLLIQAKNQGEDKTHSAEYAAAKIQVVKVLEKFGSQMTEAWLSWLKTKGPVFKRSPKRTKSARKKP